MAGGIRAGGAPVNADRRIGPEPLGETGPGGPRGRRPGRDGGCLTAPLVERGTARLGAPPTRIWDRGVDAVPPDRSLARAPLAARSSTSAPTDSSGMRSDGFRGGDRDGPRRSRHGLEAQQVVQLLRREQLFLQD